MNSQIGEFMEKYIQQVFSLKGIIVSGADGTHIFSSFDPKIGVPAEKCVELSTMIIIEFNMSNDNFKKIKSKEEMKSVNFHYEKFMLHMFPFNNIFILLFLTP